MADTPHPRRPAVRNPLTRWAAMSDAAARYRIGSVTIETAARQAAVTLAEFEQFLIDSPAKH